MKKTVLLAEDNKDDLLLMTHAWRKTTDDPLQTVKNGQEAIDYLSGEGRFADRAKYPVPCLIILDLKMPRRTGLEVLEWMRAHAMYRTIPVIVFTSSAQPDDIDRAYRLGANAFVVKPASVQKRTEFARLLKEFWLEHNHPPSACAEQPGSMRRAATHPGISVGERTGADPDT